MRKVFRRALDIGWLMSMAMAWIWARMSRCPLLVECQASVSRGDSNDKANGGAAVYRWNAALNRWTECHAALLTPLWPTKAHFFSPPEPGQAADGILGASLLSVLLPDAHFSFQEKKCSACLPSLTSISPTGSRHSSVSSMQTFSSSVRFANSGTFRSKLITASLSVIFAMVVKIDPAIDSSPRILPRLSAICSPY